MADAHICRGETLKGIRRREAYMKTEVETGVMCLQAKECQGLLATQELGGGKKAR